jgi:Uma2 family endonuclease
MRAMASLELTIPIPECQHTVRLPAGVMNWTGDEFFQFCQENRELRIERTAKGEIIVMCPAGRYSSYESGDVFRQLANWAEQDGSGIAFDSSAGFLLPNGGMRSPDAAWVRHVRLKKLSRREKEQFIPLCPDFVIEVASPSDTVSELRAKMSEYLAAGLLLGWLILPATKEVEIYTSGTVDVLNSPEAMANDVALPGFKLELKSIWNPPF